MPAPQFFSSGIARVIDTVVLMICGLAAFNHYETWREVSLDFQRYLALMLVGILIFNLFNKQLYRSWRVEGAFKLIQSTSTVIAKTWILLALGLLFTKTNDAYSRTWIVMWAIYSFYALLIARYVAQWCLGKLRARGLNLKHVVIIGAGKTATELQGRIARSPQSGFQVDQCLIAPNLEQLHEIALEPFDEIWLALAMEDHQQISHLMEGLKNSTANVRFVPDWFSYRLIKHGVSEVLGIEMVDLYGTPMTGANLYIKATEDFVISLLLIIFLSPLFLVLAIMVKLTSPGPVLYRQKRVGWNGEHFEILKFRTMPVNIEKDGVIWGNSGSKASNSRFCAWMRKSSLDELPQFFNVLKGDMSIVGPRPERPEFVEKFKD